MHFVIALTYGLTIWMASVIYALIVAPKWAGITIALAPVVISGCMVALLTLDWIICQLGKATLALFRVAKRAVKRT